MITREELLEAIEECENGKPSYNTCQKLATFYTIYDHVHAEPKEEIKTVQIEQEIVSHNGDTEFANLVDGMNAEKAWTVIDELVEAVKILHPKLYRSLIDKMAE